MCQVVFFEGWKDCGLWDVDCRGLHKWEHLEFLEGLFVYYALMALIQTTFLYPDAKLLSRYADLCYWTSRI